MLLPDWGDLDGDQQDALRGEVRDIITAYLAVTQPIVETVEELEELDDGAVVLDKMGDVSQRRGGYWCGFETKPLTDQIMRKFLPARVIWRPHD